MVTFTFTCNFCDAAIIFTPNENVNVLVVYVVVVVGGGGVEQIGNVEYHE